MFFVLVVNVFYIYALQKSCHYKKFEKHWVTLTEAML